MTAELGLAIALLVAVAAIVYEVVENWRWRGAGARSLSGRSADHPVPDGRTTDQGVAAGRGSMAHPLDPTAAVGPIRLQPGRIVVSGTRGAHRLQPGRIVVSGTPAANRPGFMAQSAAAAPAAAPAPAPVWRRPVTSSEPERARAATRLSARARLYRDTAGVLVVFGGLLLFASSVLHGGDAQGAVLSATGTPVSAPESAVASAVASPAPTPEPSTAKATPRPTSKPKGAPTAHPSAAPTPPPSRRPTPMPAPTSTPAPTVAAARLGSLIATPNPAAVGGPVTILFATTGAKTYQVVFDDGASATGSVPASGVVSVAHSYGTAGSYTVIVTVAGPGGDDGRAIGINVQ